MINRLTVLLIGFMLIVLAGCKDECEILPTVGFGSTEISIRERSSQEITLQFSKQPKPSDEFIVMVSRVGASEADYTLSEIVDQDEFILTGENPTFEVSAIFDSQIEAEEAIILTVKPTRDNFTIGTNPVLIVQLTNYNIGNNLVGEYLFNGNATDTSPDFENNGTIFGATVTTDRNGNNGATLSFDGIDDYVSIPDNSATDFNSTNDFSISLWIKPNATQSDVFHDILRKWAGDGQPYPFSISLCSSTHPTYPNQLFIANSDGSGCGNATNAASGQTINYDTFQHFVFVKSGDKLLQYLNGVKVSEVTSNIVCQTSNSTHITVGCRGQFVRFFAGKIDDLRFYNVAINQNLVNELYTETAIIN